MPEKGEIMKLGYMALDLRGSRGTIHLGNVRYPRVELMYILGCKKTRPMYVDGKDGKPRQIGWVIGPHWCELYEVHSASFGRRR